MTEWHAPADDPDAESDAAASTSPPAAAGGTAGVDEATADADAAEAPVAAGARRPAGSRRQLQLLVVAGLLVVAAAVLALIVALGGSDRPAKGSPEAIGDDFAGALRAGSAARIGELSCSASRAIVLRGAHALLGRATAASRQGGATVRDDVAVVRIAVQVGAASSQPKIVGTLGLRRVTGAWCVQVFVAAIPTS